MVKGHRDLRFALNKIIVILVADTLSKYPKLDLDNIEIRFRKIVADEYEIVLTKSQVNYCKKKFLATIEKIAVIFSDVYYS